MKKTSRRYTKVRYAIAFAIIISHAHVGRAGWTGAINGTGYGTASVNVHAFGTSGGKTKYASTTNMPNPSASIARAAGYAAVNDLPTDASPGTVSQVIGSAGYVWQANVVGSDGDDAGNVELENRVTITAADCAALKMDSSSVVDENTKTGTITVNVKGTAGTAVWFRGFELTGGEIPPEDNPD